MAYPMVSPPSPPPPPVIAPIVVQPPAVTQGWSTGLCETCSDLGICACGMFCLCCLSAQVAEGFGECFVIGWLPCSHCALRTGMRERYSIPGSMINDYCVVWCCLPCAMCQMRREIKIRTTQAIR
ncbi:cornifelin-like [Acipenser ruthenus]|uniref:cornifelin-like n=1 Tax=Acipenser ruthenus TaxID=7906 RepID=UPI0027426E70|nr:cornifelin-like [Acipenser ruthenus]